MVLPVDCKILSKVTSSIKPNENIVTIDRYEYPSFLMLSLLVCESKKSFVATLPNIAKPIEAKTPRSIALSAVFFAFSLFPSPSVLESNAFIPTPVPTDTAIINICIGYASETAASASELYLATNILSTILYSDCTKNEITIGVLIEKRSLPTGITPIRFSFFSFIISPKNISISLYTTTFTKIFLLKNTLHDILYACF